MVCYDEDLVLTRVAEFTLLRHFYNIFHPKLNYIIGTIVRSGLSNFLEGLEESVDGILINAEVETVSHSHLEVCQDIKFFQHLQIFI